MFRNISEIFFLMYRILRAIVLLFFPNFFQSVFIDGKFIPSKLYLSTKGLIFAIGCGSFFNSSSFSVTFKASFFYQFFLLMGFIVAFLYFIQLGESIYDPP